MTDPAGRKRYLAGAFPSACGKTNLAMMTPAVPGWRVHCVGDDIAWMRFDADGEGAGHRGAPRSSGRGGPRTFGVSWLGWV